MMDFAYASAVLMQLCISVISHVWTQLGTEYSLFDPACHSEIGAVDIFGLVLPFWYH